MEIIIIGLAGKKGHGKDTAANIIKRKINQIMTKYHFVSILSLADPLKEALSVLVQSPLGNFYDPQLKELPLGGCWGNESPRTLLQWFGTEIIRKSPPSGFQIPQGSSWLLECLAKRIKELKKNSNTNTVFIIPDIRFDDEAIFIKENLKGSIIHINASERINDDDVNVSHITEKGISAEYVDYFIKNNTNIRDLNNELEKCIVKLQKLSSWQHN
jgi:hypothetical protein